PTPMHYHIFGQNISLSKSPVIHNAAFAAHRLPHSYDIRDCDGLGEIEHLIKDNDFGGASVTMPHKLSVDRYCDQISDAAAAIGAINTLIARQNVNTGQQCIYGDNTDWSGLFNIVSKDQHLRSVDRPVGLIIGAGGAARAGIYALVQAGIQKIWVLNRTFDKAQKVADDFQKIANVTAVASSVEILESPDVIIGTIPGEAMPVHAFVDLFQKERGLCIEMSYKPPVTNFLSAASTHPGWDKADGLEVLLQQAFDQSRLWTGKEAPEEVMRKAMDDSFPDFGKTSKDGYGTVGKVRI
ncbi:quinate 5-dehydrogenase, protein, partial [Aspergillus steynii IBT 23096]